MDVERGSDKPTAVVIGAGFGGLSVAGRLANAGYDVTCIEKNPVPGGRCAEILRDGILLVPTAFREAFAALGEDLDSILEMVRVDPTYSVYFHDGSKLDLTGDMQRMETQLEHMERGSFKNLLALLRQGHDNLHVTLSRIAHRNFYSLFEFFSPSNFLLLLRLNVLRRHFAYVSSLFSDARLRAAFSFQDMYIGVSPYHAPATFSLLQYTEMCEGVWYCKGGLCRISEALAKAARQRGVRFMYGQEVQRIHVNAAQDGVTSVALKGGQDIHADVVVANADLPWVYRHLLPNKDGDGGMQKLNYTSSAIMFYWGVRKQYPELKTHNMFLAQDFKGSFDTIFQKHQLPADPSFYVNAPSRIDASAAPEGEDTLMVLVPCGHLEDGVEQHWQDMVQRARSTVLERLRSALGITDLEEHIKFEEVYTPQDWAEKFNLEKGSCFGLSHTFFQLGFLRPQNQHPQYRNLFFAGCSTHPGSGLPNVLVSARLTAERVLMHRCGFPTSSPITPAAVLAVLLWAAAVVWLARQGAAVTYAQFHCLFTLPLTAWLLLRLRLRAGSTPPAAPAPASSAPAPLLELSLRLRTLRRRARSSFLTLAALALFWTTPWDNYLVYKGIWSYPPNRVLLTFGWVPAEEYFFFVVQTLMTSLWVLAMLERKQLEAAASLLVGGKGARGFAEAAPGRGANEGRVRRVGVAVLLGLAGAGGWLLAYGGERTVYLALITAWALPVLALQWFFGGHVLWQRDRALWLAGVIPPTLFLWVADSWAIYLDIWNINPRYLLQLNIGPVLPVEEALFFVVTNCMVVQGMLLFVRVAEKLDGASEPSDSNRAARTSVARIFAAASRL